MDPPPPAGPGSAPPAVVLSLDPDSLSAAARQTSGAAPTALSQLSPGSSKTPEALPRVSITVTGKKKIQNVLHFPKHFL